jgi:N-acetylmuramoyl-L-alanine amidase
MGKYEVRFYTGEYRTRQLAANRDRAACYVEHHFNSGSATADYAVVVVGSNASQKSKDWGRFYAERVAADFGIRVGGVAGIMVGGYGGRGDANIRETAMPALLLEPLFCSNPRHAAWIRSPEGRQKLARALSDSIRRFFPKGGLVAFSVGHKGKPSKPHDRGAAVAGGGAEAEFAEMVLIEAKQMLEAEG